jgi:hypothetical protein
LGGAVSETAAARTQIEDSCSFRKITNQIVHR